MHTTTTQTSRVALCILFSQYLKFSNFLQTNPCQHPIVILRDITEDDLNSILKFMYHGEVQVAEEHLQDFLKTAETLQVKGLAEGGATPVLADEASSLEVSEEERLMLRRRRLMKHRLNNETNEDGSDAVDPTTESQKAPSSVSFKINSKYIFMFGSFQRGVRPLFKRSYIRVIKSGGIVV